MFTNYLTKLITPSDEYEKWIGFYCDGTNGWKVHSLIEAKNFCNSDRTCIGFLSSSVHDNVYRICANSSFMMHKKLGRYVLNIKKNNAGI